ncbi:MAG: hypothetical protein M0R35_06600 [Candidatus Omnitrophica bacterium]|nr:hypothetical protein [Candidatus Omnitrophota bacterium]
MKTHRTAFILCVIVSLPFYASASPRPCPGAKKNSTLNEALSEYSSRFTAAGNFKVINNFKNCAQGKTFHTIIARKAGKRVQVEITSGLNRNEALAYSRTQYTVVKNLYGPRQIQYPGIITNSTECPENKKTRETTIEIMNTPTKVLLANASDRYVLGVWDDDLIRQKAAFAVFYDEKNSTCYQIIAFQPYDNLDTEGLLSILSGFKIK